MACIRFARSSLLDLFDVPSRKINEGLDHVSHRDHVSRGCVDEHGHHDCAHVHHYDPCQ